MDKMLTAPLDPAIADRLLDLLGTDDTFRAQFQRDHLSALRSIGYESPTPARMTACGSVPAAQSEPFDDCKVEELAPKEAIQAARESIRAMLLAGLSQTVPNLDAVLIRERRSLK
jgi:putative modified peptide